MLSTTCHCGAVRIEIPEAPLVVTNCNCSLCRRYGGLWAYYKVGSVRVVGHPEHTAEYIWGDKTLRTVRCRHCGCVTHWEPLQPGPDSKLGVNIRNFEPGDLGTFRIRRFDGADTWTFLD
ncbi:MAG: GFA family protein [Cytophagales bacterium]|nr:GFA family protein [Rhizobacter sp.]